MKRNNSKSKRPERRDQYTEGLMGLNEKVEAGFKKVNEKLDSHSEMIAQLMLDVAEIKNDLKQKVGRDEFARLEKRVLMLERHGR